MEKRCPSPLNAIAYEVLVERGFESFTIYALRDFLFEKYRENFVTKRKLYFHLQRQMRILYEHGFLEKIRSHSSRTVTYKISDTFSKDLFCKAKTTRLARKKTTTYSSTDISLCAEMTSKIKILDVEIEDLQSEKKIFEEMLSAYPEHKLQIEMRYNELISLIKESEIRRKVMEKLSH